MRGASPQGLEENLRDPEDRLWQLRAGATSIDSFAY